MPWAEGEWGEYRIVYSFDVRARAKFRLRKYLECKGFGDSESAQAEANEAPPRGRVVRGECLTCFAALIPNSSLRWTRGHLALAPGFAEEGSAGRWRSLSLGTAF